MGGVLRVVSGSLGWCVTIRFPRPTKAGIPLAPSSHERGSFADQRRSHAYYRGFRSTPKKYTKLIHGALQLCSFLILLLGLKAVLDSHDLNVNAKTGKLEPTVNFYSVHSWIGLLAMSLFGIQWVGGFVTFFKPGASMEFRKAVMPAHRLLGTIIFVCSLSAALMGVAELSAWSMKCWLDDKVICTEMLIANLFAVILMGFAGTVLFLVAHPSWIRQPLPSDM
uniref:Cytochrome b561 domain-containing protein n=1 Tax=Ditylenchus dipsaci TaxID=166011 RepID=A0A915EP79_9BILA